MNLFNSSIRFFYCEVFLFITKKHICISVLAAATASTTAPGSAFDCQSYLRLHDCPFRSCSCRTSISAANTTFFLSLQFASFPIDVVFPTPFTPITNTTDFSSSKRYAAFLHHLLFDRVSEFLHSADSLICSSLPLLQISILMVLTPMSPIIKISSISS